MVTFFSMIQKSGAIVFDPETRTWQGYRNRDFNASKSGCCQKLSPKISISDTTLLSKPQVPYAVGIPGGVYDSKQSPNPFVTAAAIFDSSSEKEKGGGDEPW